MSSIYDPAVVSVPFSGTTDAAGNFSTDQGVRAAYWTVVKVVAETQGNAQWAIRGRGGIPLDYGNGPRISAGPFMVAPSDRITISVNSALGAATVIGNIVGRQFADQMSAAQAYNLANNPLSIAALTPPETLVNTFAIPNNTVTSKIVTLPAQVVQGFVVNSPLIDHAHFTSLNVTGVTTGTTYFFTDLVSPTFSLFVLPVGFSVNPSMDSQYKFTWTYAAGGSGNDTWLIGVQDTVRWPYARLWLPTAADGDVFVGAELGTNPNSAARPMLVSSVNASPAAWQSAQNAPFDVATTLLANNTTLGIIGAVAGQTVRLHQVTLNQDATGSRWQLEDTNAAVLGEFITPATRGVIVSADMKGAPLAVGVGLQVRNLSGGNATVSGMVTASRS